MLLWLNQSPRRNVPTSSGKPSQNSGGCYSSKGGTNSIHINAHDFEMRCSTSPHTFGHVVYLPPTSQYVSFFSIFPTYSIYKILQYAGIKVVFRWSLDTCPSTVDSNEACHWLTNRGIMDGCIMRAEPCQWPSAGVLPNLACSSTTQRCRRL